jgi:alpha-tubulin suppressor-like RCC1 family protein
MSSSDCSAPNHGHCLEAIAGQLFSWVPISTPTRPKKEAARIKGALKFGQLGRLASEDDCSTKTIVELPEPIVRVAAGGDNQSGHSAALTSSGRVYTFGCDRWQQLGLGSSSGGTAGYTWLDGKIWQRTPKRVVAMDSILQGNRGHVVDIACGFEHTACLCDNGDVVVFGRANKGQLGLGSGSGQRGNETGPWLSCPTVSTVLSDRQFSEAAQEGALRIGAEGNCTCTFSIGSDGSHEVVNCSGKCDKAGLMERMIQRIRSR